MKIFTLQYPQPKEISGWWFSFSAISPTLFTATPTVVGDTVSYAWTTSGFTFTSGGGSTAGAVIFKKDSAGTANMTLTVSGNSTSANDAVSIVARTIQKAITDGDKPSTLRAGTTFQVTNITANCIGGNAKTICLLNCYPTDENFFESIRTLNFGSRISRIVLGSPKKKSKKKKMKK